MAGQWKKQVIQVFLVMVFLTYYGGATLFPHTHIYAWGTVTHSHPYLPSATHSHTVSALQLIDALTLLVFLAGTAAFMTVPVARFLCVAAACCERVISRDSAYCHLRAPPGVC